VVVGWNMDASGNLREAFQWTSETNRVGRGKGSHASAVSADGSVVVSPPAASVVDSSVGNKATTRPPTSARSLHRPGRTRAA